MAIARLKLAAMIQFDRDPASTRTASGNHPAIGDCNNRRAAAGAIIETGMHSTITQDRMPPHAVTGRTRTRHRPNQSAPLLSHAGGLVEFAILAPTHQLHPRLTAALDPGIEQLTRLALTCRCTAIRDDDIKLIDCADVAVHVEMPARRAQIILHRTGRDTGGAHRPIKA